MTAQSWKQKNRQRFGYLMENLVADYYQRCNSEILGYDNCHAPVSSKFKKEITKFAKRLPKAFNNHLNKPASTKLTESDIRDLIMLNLIELIRFDGKQVIISEIKSRFEESDYRFEMSESQYFRFKELVKSQISCSFIYCIALPKPRMIEIPASVIIPLADISYKTKGSKIRVRIPQEYRNLCNYTSLTSEL